MATARHPALTIPSALAAVSLGLLLACPDDDDTIRGPIADCAAQIDRPSCERGSGCAWDPRDLECVVDCSRIDEMMLCDEQELCFWEGGTCHFGIA